MAQTGSKPDFGTRAKGLFFIEEDALKRRNNTPAARSLATTQKKLLELLKDVARSGDADLILSTERNFLENELSRHEPSPAGKGSIQEALDGLKVTERLMSKVRYPETYRETDETYARPRSRIGGLPRDEARQFFSSHGARLVNLDKSRARATTPAERPSGRKYL